MDFSGNFPNKNDWWWLVDGLWFTQCLFDEEHKSTKLDVHIDWGMAQGKIKRENN